MKIFNWVHRKFHQKDGGQDVMKGNELVRNDMDTLALLEHVPLAINVLDGWKDGLLAIGTLGFDPLTDLGGPHHFMQQQLYSDQEQAYSTNNYYHHKDEFLGGGGGGGGGGDGEDHGCNFEIEEEESELDPLVAAFKHGFDSDFKANANEGRRDLVDDDQFACIGGDVSAPKHYDDDHQVGGNLEQELERKKKKKKGDRRITLADLFSADSHHHDMKVYVKTSSDGHDQGEKDDQANINSKKIGADHHRVKKGVSFSKKLIPQVKEDSRPINKLHKLMTKMLKRKIHPDLQSKEAQLGVADKDGHGGNESVSLLQTQAVVA